MFTIDNIYYSSENINAMHQRFQTIDALHHKSPVAVCLESTSTWLALCLYAKINDLAVFPLHKDIPQSQAVALAHNAGCHSLLYQTLTHAIPIKAHPNRMNGGLIQMSSGTTGEPKCIHRPWACIEREIQGYNLALGEFRHATPVISCPVTHSYGLISGLLTAIARGIEPHVITATNPKQTIQALQSVEQPLLYTSPAQLSLLNLLLKGKPKVFAIMTSGSPLTNSVFHQTQQHAEHLLQQYGCSEAGCISINTRLTHPAELGYVLPHLTAMAGESEGVPAEIRIVPREAQQAPICTRDLGFFTPDCEGRPVLRFVARTDDTIIVSGLNVYPIDIESALLLHPDISDAVAFGYRGTFTGQRIGVCYVASSRTSASSLREWCLSRLAGYQLPHHFNQVSAIPRLPNGKVQRRELANRFQPIAQLTVEEV